MTEYITAICLCLDKRKEHWKRLQKECEDQQIKFIPFICGDGSDPDLIYNQIDQPIPTDLKWNYSAEGHIVNHYNAFRAHRAMAKIGLSILESDYNLPMEQILFLEDDSTILPRFSSLYKNYSFGLFPYGSILYLGYWTGRENDIQIEKEYQENKQLKVELAPVLGGLHGAILGETALKAIIDMKPIDPVDAQLNRLTLNRYIMKPKLISTINTYSYTEGINIERDYL